jgi:hypothetical protein
MPVLREHNMLESRRDAVDDVNHRGPIRNGKRAAGTEIVLYVNNKENVLAINLHEGAWHSQFGICSTSDF